MKKILSWLSGLLALQLGLSGALYWHGHSSPGVEPAAPLLSVSIAAVDRMVISDGDNEAVIVRAAVDTAAGNPGDGGWQLPGLGELPADSARSSAALSRLAAVQTGWPVTTTAASHQRFEVADDNFQRRVQLYSDGDLAADLLLGTSPGFRKVHLRRTGESSVYAVELSTFELPAGDNDWLDKSLLASPEATRIEGADLSIERVGDDWRRPGAGNNAGESEPATANGELASALTGLEVTGLAAATTELPQQPVKAFVISGPDGYSRRLEFFRTDQDYLVKEAGSDRVFTVSQYDFEQITGEADAATTADGAVESPPPGR